MPMIISKSKFVAGWQCLKRLYLLVHKPDSADDVDAGDFALMEQGQQVGELARGLFPGGILVEAASLGDSIRITRELLARPDVPAIFEGAFEHGGVYVRVGILQRCRGSRWRLIEIKSSASLKDEHLPDVAIQSHVLTESGIDLASCFLAHVNRAYIYPGGAIDPWRFFRIKNVTRRIESLLPKVPSQLRAEFRVISSSEAPEIESGPHCSDPRRCEFYDRCNLPIPDNDVRFLPNISTKVVIKLRELGVSSIRDIPDAFE